MPRATLPLLLLLSACSGVQGVPVAPRAPSFSPTTDAPITVGQPGYVEHPDVPRGTDKRVLPPTKEPGIWASDADNAPPAAPLFLGVLLPYFDDAQGEPDVALTRYCAKALTHAAGDIGGEIFLRKTLNDVEIRCLAGRLYLKCTEEYRAFYEAHKANLSWVDRDFETRVLPKTLASARDFTKSQCRFLWIGEKMDKAFDVVTDGLRAQLQQSLQRDGLKP